MAAKGTRTLLTEVHCDYCEDDKPAEQVNEEADEIDVAAHDDKAIQKLCPLLKDYVQDECRSPGLMRRAVKLKHTEMVVIMRCLGTN